MSVDELRREAELLPESERGQLIVELLSTLDYQAYDVSDEEVERRVAETESGAVEDISLEDLKAGLGRRSRE